MHLKDCWQHTVIDVLGLFLLCIIGLAIGGLIGWCIGWLFNRCKPYLWHLWPYQVYKFILERRLHKQWKKDNYKDLDNTAWDLLVIGYASIKGEKKSTYSHYRRNIFRKYYKRIMEEMLQSEPAKKYFQENS